MSHGNAPKAIPDGGSSASSTFFGYPKSETAIAIRGVDHHYGSGEVRSQVLFSVDLQIGRGELVIMTGPSGSGKTTLLTLIGALRHVQAGSVQVLGRELRGLSSQEQVRLRRKVGFIFQHHNLFSSLSALENVRMATALQDATADEMERRSVAMLGRLGLQDRLNSIPARLSGGQRQRVAIARAVVNDPALVLADEPTAALDAVSGETVMNLLHELTKGPIRATVLIVTHDQRIISRADRIVSMFSGRVVSNVRPELSIRICQALAQTRETFGLATTTLTRLADHMVVENRRAGETIVQEGVVGDRAYVIGQGVAEAVKGDSPPRELHIGDRFGRITAIANERISETVRAKTNLELFVLTQENLQLVMATDSSLEERIRLYYMNRQTE